MSINVEKCNLNRSPKCPHGPTILFSRNTQQKRKFYACSACRSRKDCSFFLWKDELDSVGESTKNSWECERKKYLKGINRIKRINVMNKIKNMPDKERNYCFSCDRFVFSKFVRKHAKHNLLKEVSDDLLQKPSHMLKPLDNNKKEAQYLFSLPTIKIFINIFEKLNIRNVLCVGSPRIHEYILMENLNIKSLLLDFDKRYHNFYDLTQFCWYNMFNHHFFLGKSKNTFKQFLRKSMGDLILVADPPFGGRVELLAKTFNRIDRIFKKLNANDQNLKILLIFPYFMEPQILNSLPHFNMLDYKVDYDNHILFQDGPKGRKQGSPVRIFTNIQPNLIPLPEEEGYKYCPKCIRWVSAENQHCNQCNACTSKDGRTYVHCSKCHRCVKPTWQHCNTCNRCAQPNHQCGELTFEKKCFHCHKEGHKKRECPLVNHELLQKKRRK